MNEPQNTEPGMKSELRSDAQELGSTAKDRIHSEIDSRKGTAATQAKSVSSAMERTAGELGPDSPEWLKSAIRQAATQVQRFADTIEQKDSRELIDDISNFARNSPGTFLFGCAAAGFAAARIFKAGASQTSSEFETSYPQSNWVEDSGGDQSAFGSSGTDAGTGFSAGTGTGTGTGAGFAPASSRGEFV